ncbi:FecR domain-containing protein [Parerythrobacter aestuarii]|uniref:FecR domain-containing protein n=1 Tax=Parerythrobacter aestuarii TaxID=3020909 RepID=UPI0024DE59B5|nr:FecR domain-containing protein [Parerythrobacter aestuarii]
MPRRTWQRAVASQDLKAGDVLRTNASGTLAIVFADGTQIRLGRNSTLVVKRVAKGGPSAVSLQRGKAWGRSPRSRTKLSVETPSATAAIRGTEWAIEAGEDLSRLQVFSGAVEFANDAGSLLVEAGQAATARRGQAPTRTVLANPAGREQMLYFVDVGDGLDILASDAPAFAEGRALLARRDWVGAEQAFARLAASSDPQDRAAGQYGRYVALVQHGEAPDRLHSTDGAAGYVAQALVAAYDGDLRSALELAARGQAAFPEAPSLYQAKAQIEALLGEPDAALATVDAGLRLFPDNTGLAILSADLLRDYRGSPKAARDRLSPILEADPDNVSALTAQARNWIAIGGTLEAARLVEHGLAVRPDDAELVSLRAQVLLAQNRLEDAKIAIETALEIDPGNPLAGAALAQYWARKDVLELALQASLAASARNPDYGAGFLSLAQVQYELGETGIAEQQFDTADRLDPANPAMPLARTAVALQDFDGDAAITNAREALARYRARGGEYVNLSENRQTGSLVSQAFRFLDLEGWGRYYADRVFDSFTPSSYFDQALNQTPGPFLIRNPDGSFDAQRARNFDRESSFLQGVALDPLSVASSGRRLRFDNGNFFEPNLGVSWLKEDLRDERTVKGGLDTIFDAPVPTAIWLRGNYRDYTDHRRRPDLSPFSRRRGGEDWSIAGYLGVELTPADSLVFSGEWNRRTNLSESDMLALANDPFELEQTGRRDDNFLFGLYTHELGYRDMLTVSGGIGKASSRTDTIDISSLQLFADRLARQRDAFTYLGLGYAKGIGDTLDLRIGVEWSDVRSRLQANRYDYASGQIDPVRPALWDFEDNASEGRAYLDLRYQPVEAVVLQGQAEIIARTIIGVTDYPFNWRMGVSWEPAAGQWLRASVIRQRRGLFDFSFRPVAAVGLQPLSVPSYRQSSVDAVILRWDAEWSGRLFTSVEYQDLDLEAVFYQLPDLPVDVEGFPVSLRRISAQANVWLGGNVGLRFSYAYTDSSIDGSFISGANVSQAIGPSFGCSTPDLDPTFLCRYQRGDQLPFVPGHFGRASLVWSLPAPTRLKVTLSGSYIGDQTDDLRAPLEDVALVDAQLEWEPMDRRFVLSLSLLNLLDKRYNSATGVAAPGITVLAGAGVRF